MLAVRNRWKCEEECAALARFGLHPNPAAVILDNFLAVRKPDAMTLDFVAVKILVVLSPTELEDSLVEIDVAGNFGRKIGALGDSHAVVAHAEQPRVVLISSGDLNLKRLQRAVLDGVFNQIEEYRLEALPIGEDARQKMIGNPSAGGVNIRAKLVAHFAN